jgi:glutamyl-tRNA reductase
VSGLAVAPLGVPWVIALGPAETTAVERASVATSLDAIDTIAGALALNTCRRLELFGFGEPPSVEALARATGLDDVLSARVFVGHAAIERVLRLAAGLESSVVGEDQILHQVRSVLGAGSGLAPDPRLRRLIEIAIGVGRRARAGRPPQVERSLADRGIAWLEARLGPLARRTIVVAGAGPIGSAAARGMRRLGTEVVVASRDPRRALDLATEVGGRPTTLVDVVRELHRVDAVVVALAGPWIDLAAAGDPLPWLVDLSAPTAVPAGIVDRLRERFVDLDTLTASDAGGAPDAVALAAFTARAEAHVTEAAGSYEAWLDGRRSVATLRALRSRADARRAAELDRLFRRLPDLDERERGLIERLSQQLVAAVLHEPSQRLRDDRDGSSGAAARTLFALDARR